VGDAAIALVATPSIDAFVIYKAPDQIRTGDLVSFTLSDPIAGPKPVSVTKYALCLPGERIDMIEKPSAMGETYDGWYFCNARLLGISKPRTRDGRPSPIGIPRRRSSRRARSSSAPHPRWF
jgi:hypothetical protein